MRLLALLVPVLLFALPVAAQGLKLVVQAAGPGAFDAAAWTPDGRWVVEASGQERMVRIWDPDVDEGRVVDAMRLPLPQTDTPGELWISGLTVSADGRRAKVEATLRTTDPLPSWWPRAVDYEVDLVARRVRVVDPAPRKAVEPPEITSLDDIEAARLPLPSAPDGRQLKRLDGGVAVLSAKGDVLATTSFGATPTTPWATVSPDGTKLVFLSNKPDVGEEPAAGAQDGAQGKPGDGAAADPEPVIQTVVMNLETGQAGGSYGKGFDNFGNYGRAAWTGDGRLLISEESSSIGRDAEVGSKGDPATGWLLDLDGDRSPFEVPPRCYMQPLGPERIVGAGLSSCRTGVPGQGLLWVRSLEGGWTEVPLGLPRQARADGLRASADGRLVALSLSDAGDANSLIIVEAASGRILHRRPAMGTVTSFNFLPDGTSLVLLDGERPVHWQFEAGRETALPASDFEASLVASDGRSLMLGNMLSPNVQRFDLGDGTKQPALDLVGPVSGGFLGDRPIFWAANMGGEVALFDSRDWSLIATVLRFVDGEGSEFYLVHDPAGRFDTNLSPDAPWFRWLVDDAPFQSLGPQTFMRELYTPGLLARLIECTPDRSCARALPVAVKPALLNRALPEVSDMVVRPGKVPGTVDVEVTVREGVNSLPSGAYGQATSGMHNLRLFRDGVLVREAGAVPPGLDPADKAGWRRATRLEPNLPDGGHRARFEGIPLPTGPRDGPFLFSAYAFNEDRVRGEQAEAKPDQRTALALAPALASPRARRLFVVSIGIDAYPGGLFRPLRYAVADAQAMAELFGRATLSEEMPRPPLQRVPIRIEGTADRPATRADVERAFAQLRRARPDDVVVISFSGHGYTDAAGRFFLVPSDVRSVVGAGGEKPVPASMIAADDLAGWLAPVDAGAIYMVIDACHSAASVQAGGFKPGPMGDPGLGQLAHDKGISILSASAPDQFAMEASDLGHGLLTYAFVVEGAWRGKADVPEGDEDPKPDGHVTMDELMDHAVRALPAAEARFDEGGARGDGPGLVVEWKGPPPPRQTPRLFNFAADWSRVGVAVGPPPGLAPAGGAR